MTNKALFCGSDGVTREIEIKLTAKQKKELEKIRKQVEEDLKPLYDELGVNPKIEELHWTNGEVFVINKATGKRREIGQSQAELNNMLWRHSISLSYKRRNLNDIND